MINHFTFNRHTEHPVEKLIEVLNTHFNKDKAGMWDLNLDVFYYEDMKFDLTGLYNYWEAYLKNKVLIVVKLEKDIYKLSYRVKID